MSLGGGGKPPRLPPPPNTPTRADATAFVAGSDISKPLIGDDSLIRTGPLGLTRKADTVKRKLIGA